MTDAFTETHTMTPEARVVDVAEVARLPLHPLTRMLRPIKGPPFTVLAKDLAENGQMLPIYTWNGALLDGRARLRATIEAGVQHVLVKDKSSLTPEELVGWYWYINNVYSATRKDDNVGQRALAGYRLFMLGHETQSRKYPVPRMRQDEVANIVRVGRTSIYRAGVLFSARAEDLIEQVDTLVMDLNTAVHLVKERGEAPTVGGGGARTAMYNSRAMQASANSANKKTPNTVRAHALHTVSTMAIVLAEHKNAPLPPADIAQEWIEELEESLTWLNDLRDKLLASLGRDGE